MTELFNTEALNPSLKTLSQADLDHYAPHTVEDLNERLPQYEFIELIAVGGMGAVYKARQPKLDRLIAIKLLPKMDHDEYGFGDRFEQEAKAMAKLSHPHIVPIFDFGETKGGQAYFVMEFIEGADMFQLICGGQLTLAHFFGWIPQVCSAIQYAHKRDIVHRDIKPANILIDKEGNVKMADFGLARLTGAKPTWDPDDENSAAEIDEDAISMGTPGFAAPEQFNKDAQVDGRADIYALGVVMYQMLTGQMPKGAFPMPSECNPHIDIRLDEVVLRAMQEDADDRFQTIGEISDRLAAIHATKNGMPGKEPEKRQAPVDDPSITPSGKRLITGPVRAKSKSPPLTTGRVSTLTGKINIPADRVAAAGKPPTLVTGRITTLPSSNSNPRPSTELRRSIDRRNSSRPPYIIPFIIVAIFLIIFAIVKTRKAPEKNTQIGQQQLMEGIAASVTTKNTKSRLADKSFVFIKKIPTFNQDEIPLAIMRRDREKLNASGVTHMPEKFKAIHTLKISGAHTKNSKPFALALHHDGTLSAWGDNSHKQLDIPKNLGEIIAITAGNFHSPLFVFAWPSSPIQATAHNNAPANNAPRPTAPPFPDPNTKVGQRIAEIESESKTIYTTQFKQPFG